ncbi:hypothetical protein RHGRI_005469 [Rhododendron griersonianum]|uniref:Uncharacterized protein n=1 Tax=Rhododendron griersonianum TaxID=479676 RepID=A0AAV6LCE4_9ERIC|nr:hypothetical protein RHGRI_005469 [Rhododendron griersonianum]
MNAATACYGNDASQFPSSNLFGAAGEGIWGSLWAAIQDHGTLHVQPPLPRTCIPNKTIQIRIVDRAQTSVSKPTRGGTAMVLTTTAFGTIANGSSASIC